MAALEADHPAVAEGLQRRSETSFALGRGDEALADATQALTIRRAKLSGDHPALIRSVWLLGHIHFLRGEMESAKTCWDEALQRAARACGKDKSDVKRLLKNITWPQTRVRDPAD